jgi:Domain of unknown function (DUF5710)
MPRIDLNVPFHEKDDAKRSGARWDPERKTWFVPEGADSGAFQRWIREMPHINIRSSTYWIVTSNRKCWKCERATEVFAFALPEDHCQLEFADDAPADDTGQWEPCGMRALPLYIEHLTEAVQIRIREVTPHYRLDFSQTIGSSYWMNHCEFCEAKQGDHELFCEPGAALMPVTSMEMAKIRTALIPEPFAACAGEWFYEPEFLL